MIQSILPMTFTLFSPDNIFRSVSTNQLKLIGDIIENFPGFILN